MHKSPLSPNPDKKLEIKTGEKTYLRFTIQTDTIKKNDNIIKIISAETQKALKEILSSKKYNLKKSWFITISEKVVAISQGRSFLIKDIKPGFSAKFLYKFVTKTPHGIGLRSPWTMQLAIQEVGLPRILLASFLSLITKPFKIRGVFYRVAGRAAASIDGPTEYSLYPSNVSAKLGPKNPGKVAEDIHKKINETLTPELIKNFLGVVIIDANDLGRDILGNSTDLSNNLIAKIFADNPMGQSREQTPLTIVLQK